jgi:uncharacterized tellurite resistance protein B-like protein
MSIVLTESEKLAFVKMIDGVIQADEIIHDAEIEIMSQLMSRFDFDSKFVAKAKKENLDDCISILTSLPSEKKSSIIQLLNVVAMSDGFVHKNELNIILEYCQSIGLCNKIG